jgi:hypothetical protein
MQSTLTLAPEIKSFADPAPIQPGPVGLYPIAVAGKTVAF